MTSDLNVSMWEDSQHIVDQIRDLFYVDHGEISVNCDTAICFLAMVMVAGILAQRVLTDYSNIEDTKDRSD